LLVGAFEVYVKININDRCLQGLHPAHQLIVLDLGHDEKRNQGTAQSK
jgi:hypothetical protein